MKSNGLSRGNIPDHIIPRFWSRVEVRGSRECWPWTGTIRSHGTRFQYGQIGFSHTYKLTHVFAYAVSRGDVPPGICVCHNCDNPICCNPSHLFLGTKSDNNKDRTKKGRNGDHKGSNNGMAILSGGDVVEIRKASDYMPYKLLADRYGVAVVTIAKIVQRKLWKHIP